MTTAKVFMSGRSQAVRLPLEFRFDTAEVYIRRTTDGGVLLTPKRGLRLGDALAEAFDRLPVDGSDGDFERPDQGEHERTTDLFGTGDAVPRGAEPTQP
jgi:antitoxin VapB